MFRCGVFVVHEFRVFIVVFVQMDLAVQCVQSWGRQEAEPAARLGRLALCKAAFKAGVPLPDMMAMPPGSEARRMFDDITILVHWL